MTQQKSPPSAEQFILLSIFLEISLSLNKAILSLNKSHMKILIFLHTLDFQIQMKEYGVMP
jgi:hypothetical protein